MWRHLAGVALALTLAAPAGAQALDDVLGPETLVPSQAARVEYAPAAPVAEEMDPEAMARDPARLALFFRQDPRRLETARMTPELARMLSGILLRGNETFLAEKLLHNAAKRWPEETPLTRAWARVLLSLGRPEAARRVLEETVAAAPKDPTAQYLLGRAYMSIDARDPASQDKILAAFEATLAAAPDYRDSDGVGANEIRAGIEQIRRNRDPRAGPEGGASSTE